VNIIEIKQVKQNIGLDPYDCVRCSVKIKIPFKRLLHKKRTVRVFSHRLAEQRHFYFFAILIYINFATSIILTMRVLTASCAV